MLSIVNAIVGKLGMAAGQGWKWWGWSAMMEKLTVNREKKRRWRQTVGFEEEMSELYTSWTRGVETMANGSVVLAFFT